MASPDPRREPSALHRELAATVRQLYLALMAEGFTERQALVIVGQTLTAAAQQGKKDE